MVLDEFYHFYDYWRYYKKSTPDICPSLRHYTLSGKKDRITGDLLLRCINPVLERNCTLPLLTIGDMKLVMKANGGFELEGDGRFHQLLFENIRRYFEIEIDHRSPTNLTMTSAKHM